MDACKKKDMVNYLTALVSEFAHLHSLNGAQAFRYLDRYGGIDFVVRHYEAEHTLPFYDVVTDLTDFCHRKGGALQ